jgi:hypothetical protein
MSAVYQGASALAPTSAITRGFNWTVLLAGSIVVDGGDGGCGSMTLSLAQAIPQLIAVVLDRTAVISEVTKPVISRFFFSFNVNSYIADKDGK